MTQQSGRPTLADIAAAAGVSLPTVSKVLNGKHDVASTTRAHVQQLLEQHNYVPLTRRAPEEVLVDVVFTALDSPWAVEILRGITESGLEVVVSTDGAHTIHAVSGEGSRCRMKQIVSERWPEYGLAPRAQR